MSTRTAQEYLNKRTLTGNSSNLKKLWRAHNYMIGKRDLDASPIFGSPTKKYVSKKFCKPSHILKRQIAAEIIKKLKAGKTSGKKITQIDIAKTLKRGF